MSKIVNCQTVICTVNGVTLLDLSLNSSQNISIDKKFDENSVGSVRPIHLEDNNEEYVQQIGDNDDNDVSVGPVRVGNSGNESRRKARILPAKGIYEMEVVNTSIESVRQYVHTTRRDGKVWHMCQWAPDPKDAGSCEYGSKWSGAMVNHIRSHLGIKPFRCLYCDKLFTIPCNLKNHLRSHHGLKAKIILNGGRSGSKSGSEEDMAEEVSRRVQKSAKSSKKSVISVKSKHSLFKPSLIYGKDKESRYNVPQMERRTLPKRNVKKNQKYIDFEEDFEEEEDFEMAVDNNQVDEEVAEEDNRKFYQKTEEEEVDEEIQPEDTEDNNDDTSRFVVKRKYNKKVWFVCVWNPRQCKYRSHVRNEVLNHVKKHQNIRQFICNWNHCSASFVNQYLLESHQQIHKRQKYFKCTFPNCGFQTINEIAIKMHKIRHKRQMNDINSK